MLGAQPSDLAVTSDGLFLASGGDVYVYTSTADSLRRLALPSSLQALGAPVVYDGDLHVLAGAPGGRPALVRYDTESGTLVQRALLNNATLEAAYAVAASGSRFYALARTGGGQSGYAMIAHNPNAATLSRTSVVGLFTPFSSLIADADGAYFTGDESAQVTGRVYRFDAASASVRELDSRYTSTRGLAAFGGDLYFSATTGSGFDFQLRRYDPDADTLGTAGRVVGGSQPLNPVAGADSLYLTALFNAFAQGNSNTSRLGVYDPSTQTIRAVTSTPGAYDYRGTGTISMANDRVYFLGTEIAPATPAGLSDSLAALGGTDLMVYDPTTNTHDLAADISPGTEDANITALAYIDGRYFGAGRARSDGFVIDEAADTTLFLRACYA